jgi:multiple sugar transport system ATP-binding protein
MNFLEGRASGANGSGLSFASDGLANLELPLQSDSVTSGQAITVGIRPEHIELVNEQVDGGVKAVVNIVENLGGETYLHVELAPEQPLLMVKLHGSRGPSRGDRITLHFPADRIYLFDAAGAAIPVKLLNEETKHL